MNTVYDMAVEWHFRYGNLPDLRMVLDEYLPFDQRIWHGFEQRGGIMWISRHEPMVSFLFEPTPPPGGERTKYGGALGGPLKLEDGSVHNAKQCWSSNEGQIHKMRSELSAVSELLPHEIVDITVHTGEWTLTGMAGLFWDKPWVEDMLELYLPEIELLPHLIGGGILDATQTSIAGSTDESSVYWVPYLRDLSYVKPEQEHKVGFRTSYEYRRNRKLDRA